MPAFFGLDIGSSSIKLVEISGKSVNVAAVVPNPTGKVGVDLVPAEQTALVETVKQLLSTHKTKSRKVVISIAESLVYTRVMRFPVMSTPELATAIKWEAEQAIPFPIDKIELSWMILYKPKDLRSGEKMKVLVVGVPMKVSGAYIDFLDNLGLEAVRVENELVSLVRSMIVVRKLVGVTMIVDLGHSSTKIVVADTQQIYANYVSAIGGQAFTKIIADTFKLSIPQAEEYKRTYGLDKQQIEGKIYNAVEPVLSGLMTDIGRVMTSYLSNYPERKIDRVILVGGSAYMKGLLGIVVSQTGLDVSIGNAFEGLKVPENIRSLGTIYPVAVGLASEEE